MANYDAKPSKLEAVGNGSYLYRFNIKEKTEEFHAKGQDEPVVTRTSWECEEVTVWSPLTSNKITEAVIGTLCPVSHEQKLVNEYNAANLGLVGGSKTSDAAKTAISRYKEFLEQRTALKSMVDADCEELGIR